MSDFVFFEGRIDHKRELPKAQDSGLQYRNSVGNFVSLSHDEMKSLTEYMQAYILKKLWLRERAACHYRWVNEPTMRLSAIRGQCNAYRDRAKQKAAGDAIILLRGSALIQEMSIPNPDVPGPTPIRYRMTPRGASWFKSYCDWFEDSFGRPFVLPPKRDQYVDEDGNDKDESSLKIKVKANKGAGLE